jgi:hypothetical protein
MNNLIKHSNDTKQENQVPGVLCPGCKKFHIRLSLEQLLYGKDAKCGSCGLSMAIDRSRDAKMMELLQDLYIATKNVEALRNQSF